MQEVEKLGVPGADRKQDKVDKVQLVGTHIQMPGSVNYSWSIF